MATITENVLEVPTGQSITGYFRDRYEHSSVRTRPKIIDLSKDFMRDDHLMHSMYPMLVPQLREKILESQVPFGHFTSYNLAGHILKAFMQIRKIAPEELVARVNEHLPQDGNPPLREESLHDLLVGKHRMSDRILEAIKEAIHLHQEDMDFLASARILPDWKKRTKPPTNPPGQSR